MKAKSKELFMIPIYLKHTKVYLSPQSVVMHHKYKYIQCIRKQSPQVLAPLLKLKYNKNKTTTTKKKNSA